MLRHPSPELARILALTGLAENGPVADGTEAAMAERFGHPISRPFQAEESSRELSRV